MTLKYDNYLFSHRLEPNDYGNILRIIVPDIVMFIVSLMVFLFCRRLCLTDPLEQETDAQMSDLKARILQHGTSLMKFISDFMVTLFLAASGIASPSVLTAVYFVSFLGVATWWACYNKTGRYNKYFRLVLLIYSGLHLTFEYLYQFQFFQEALPPNRLISRYTLINTFLNLCVLLKYNC